MTAWFLSASCWTNFWTATIASAETDSLLSFSNSKSFGNVDWEYSGRQAIFPSALTASAATWGRSQVVRVSSSREIWCEVPGALSANVTRIPILVWMIGSPSDQKTKKCFTNGEMRWGWEFTSWEITSSARNFVSRRSLHTKFITGDITKYYFDGIVYTSL